MNSTLEYEIEEKNVSSHYLFRLPEYRIPSNPLLWISTPTVTSCDILTLFFQEQVALATSTVICSGAVILPTTDWSLLDICHITQSIPTISIKNNNPVPVDELLGETGKSILDKAIEAICVVSRIDKWPLDYIEIEYIEDIEVEGWKYILVNLVFDASQEIVEDILYKCFDLIDNLSDTLSPENQELLQRKLYFDARTTI
ncbi:MAG: hypothetical protein JW712_06700 [Dehalococcoidales bacterium]|nr:hypothetical protein [Dehalococcoidales bacterium]